MNRSLLFFALIFFSLGRLPAAVPSSILILGDSITAGYGLDREQAYPALLQKNIEARRLPYTVINAGMSGDTSAGGLSRLDWILKHSPPPAVLIVALGANDGLRGLPVKNLQENLQAIIARVRQAQPTVKVLIAGMLVPPNMGSDYARDFSQVFATVAQKEQAVLIPFLLDRVAGLPDLNQDDQIHPTAAGQKIVATTVWKYLEPILVK